MANHPIKSVLLVGFTIGTVAFAQNEPTTIVHRLAEAKAKEVATMAPNRWPDLAYILNKNVAPPFFLLPDSRVLHIYSGVIKNSGVTPINQRELVDRSKRLQQQWGIYASLIFEHNKQGRIAYDIYACRINCEGHEDGYKWAEREDITAYSNCVGSSESFIEGCYVWVTRQKGNILPRQ